MVFLALFALAFVSAVFISATEGVGLTFAIVFGVFLISGLIGGGL